MLRGLAHNLAAKMPEGYGFTLLIFGFQTQDLFYISSGQRQDIIRTMREFIAKFEEN